MISGKLRFKETQAFKHKTIIKNSCLTPVITLTKGAFLVTQKLHGENADYLCNQMADKIALLMAGHPSIIDEVYTNKESTLELHRYMRAAVQAQEGMPIQEMQVVENGAGQVLDANHLQVAIRTAVNDAVVYIREDESKKRIRMLNDNRTAEARRDRERKHEMKLEEEKTKRVKLEQEVQLQRVSEEEKTKQVQEIERTKQVEQMERTKQMKEENRTRELEIRKMELEKQAVPVVPVVPAVPVAPVAPVAPVVPAVPAVPTEEAVVPCTIDRVNEKYQLLKDIRDKKMIKNILQLAGQIAVKDPYKLTPLREKTKSLDKQFDVNQFPPSDTVVVIQVIHRAMQEELSKMEQQLLEQAKAQVKPINVYFMKQ